MLGSQGQQVQGEHLPLVLACNDRLNSDCERLCFFFHSLPVCRHFPSLRELWRRTLESKGFRLSRTKTEYMMSDFSATRHEGGDVSLDGQVVVQKDTFRYLGSVLQKMATLMKMLGIEFQLAG